MRSIGNDIVSLALTDKARTHDARFRSKFMTDGEQALYLNVPKLPFESYVWLLWSVKESAYKYLKRLDHSLVFSPAKIIVQNIQYPVTSCDDYRQNGEGVPDTFYRGMVEFGDSPLYYGTMVTGDTVMSIAGDEPSLKNVYWEMQTINDTDNEGRSVAVRELLTRNLKTSYPESNFTIQKSPLGYPIVTDGVKNEEILVSFSHHGCSITYCYYRKEG